MEEHKKFQEITDELGLVKLHEDIIDAMHSRDPRFIESVAIRATKAAESLKSYSGKGNSDAKLLLSLFSLKVLTYLADDAFKVKKPLEIFT